MPKEIRKEDVEKALSTVIEPELHKDLISLNFVRNIRIDGNDVEFTIMLTTPACPLMNTMKEQSEEAVRSHIPEVQKINVNFDSRVRSDGRIQEKLNLPIRNILAVGSGKGGVGKRALGRSFL